MKLKDKMYIHFEKLCWVATEDLPLRLRIYKRFLYVAVTIHQGLVYGNWK